MASSMFRVGGLITDTPSGILCFSLNNGGTITITNFQTLTRNGVSYQVTAGKTLYITKIIVHAASANAIISAIGYADIAATNATVPTGFVNMTASLLTAPIANTPTVYDNVLFAIPATKYPVVQAGSATPGMQAWGYEL